MKPIVDPRLGDIEDDASSPRRHSMFALAGSLLAEISLPKLVVAWLLLIVAPGVILGLAPLVATAWIGAVWGKVSYPTGSISSLFFLAGLAIVGWFGAGALLRATNSSFWSLISLSVEPGYVTAREMLRHFAERAVRPAANPPRMATLRRASAVAAGILICGVSLGILALAWPHSRWVGTVADLASLHRLGPAALANATVLVVTYFTTAAIGWTVADARMAHPRDLDGFAMRADNSRVWRIAHLSDIHVVGERYGLRIESGRAGPRGNERLRRALTELDELHATAAIDILLISGDVTDAGRASEWAEFLDILASHPTLAAIALLLPGNHDLNIVDRANPARLDLPTSPKRRLRMLRALSALNEVQGARVRVVDRALSRVSGTLADAIGPHRAAMAAFADTGRPLMSKTLNTLWKGAFPMVVPPDHDGGLGILLLNSNADTHFAFTNALGMIPREQLRGVEIARAHYPRACWIVALHHHLVEYPRPAKALSERVGTALINGSWFVRRLRPMAHRVVLMHGHRHVDWTGECAGLLIVSAPSVVMEATDGEDAFFYIQNLQISADGTIRLLAPQRVVVPGQPAV